MATRLWIIFIPNKLVVVFFANSPPIFLYSQSNLHISPSCPVPWECPPFLAINIHPHEPHSQNSWMATQYIQWALGLASERQQQDPWIDLPIGTASVCPFTHKASLWLSHCLPIYWESQSHGCVNWLVQDKYPIVAFNMWIM